MLPEAEVRDISRELPSMIHPSDYYPLLTVQAGSNEIADRSLRTIKRDFRGLGQLVDGAGVQVVFSSVPSVAAKDTERSKRAHLINTQLRGWCNCRKFVFF